jgi:hypothetical protein
MAEKISSNNKLISEWNWDKNNELGLDPSALTCGSGKKVWWKCKYNHEWYTSVYNKVKSKGCPICENRLVLVGFNDLATKYPELIHEWNYLRNLPLTPNTVTFGSAKKVWWICSKCQYEWRTLINLRTRGYGCPNCAKEKISNYRKTPKINQSLGDLYPELIKEWNTIKNINLSPYNFTPFSQQRVWWICSEGHEWEAPVQRRVSGNNCPYCSGRRPILGHSDLVTTHPNIAKEWNYDLNGDLKPQDVKAGSYFNVWWQCEKGHVWKAKVQNRVNNRNCPYCSNKKILMGYNDLATVNPNLAKEWHPTKNLILKPTEVAPNSGKIVWWKCHKGHEWEAQIQSRNKGNGCPYCSMSLRSSFPEKSIAYYCNKTLTGVLESGVLENVNKTRLSWLNKMELDIFIPDLNLAIEYDGPLHTDEKDVEKNHLCYEHNINLIRIRDPRLQDISHSSSFDFKLNSRSELDLEKAIFFIINKIKEKTSDNLLIPEINIINDRLKIYELLGSFNKSNSICITHPDLVSEWHPTYNGNLLPSEYTAGSNIKVWWLCALGHEWQASISHRTSGRGCPVCSHNKVKEGFNDLLTINPILASEWDYSKNLNFKPTMFTANSNKKFWWKCTKCGHQWYASVYNRNNGRGCPNCYKNRFKR